MVDRADWFILGSTLKMTIRMNFKVLILSFLLSACKGDSEELHQNDFDPCDSVHFEYISDYPSELDSLIHAQLEGEHITGYSVDTMFITHPVKQPSCKIDSSEYFVKININDNNTSQVWLFRIRKRDWFLFFRERLK